jgi:hypothetical protein
MRPIIIILVAVAALTDIAGVRAMHVEAVGHQLTLSGPVVAGALRTQVWPDL